MIAEKRDLQTEQCNRGSKSLAIALWLRPSFSASFSRSISACLPQALFPQCAVRLYLYSMSSPIVPVVL